MLHSTPLFKLKHKNGKMARHILPPIIQSFIHPSHISNAYSLFARSYSLVVGLGKLAD